MNDDILVSLGRQFVEMCVQRENLIRTNMQLTAEIEKLKKDIDAIR